MAKGGPLILLGGAAALLLLKKKKPTTVVPPVEEPIEEEGEEATEHGGSGGGGGEAYGNPPNFSGDPAGYNTQLFPGPAAVRQILATLGYADADLFSEKPLVKKPFVKNFQKDYNKYSNKMAANGDHSLGRLSTDGTAGKNTLNAVEAAMRLVRVHQKTWKSLVG